MILLSFVLLAAPTAEANAAGMKLYQAKKYAEAAQQFRKAVQAAKTDQPGPTTKEAVQLTRTKALAHFNLACTLALIRKTGRVCDADAYRSTITELVEQSILFDPNRLEKALTDSDLSNIRDTLAYQSWSGLSVLREEDLAKLVPAVRWWSLGAGVYGSTNELSFSPKGSVTVAMMVFDQEGVPLPKRKTVIGSWTLQGRRITLSFPAVVPELKAAKLEGVVTEAGRLVFSQWVEFTDSPSECEA